MHLFIGTIHERTHVCPVLVCIQKGREPASVGAGERVSAKTNSKLNVCIRLITNKKQSVCVCSVFTGHVLGLLHIPSSSLLFIFGFDSAVVVAFF